MMTLDELVEPGWAMIDANREILERDGGCGIACLVIVPGNASVRFECEDASNPEAKERLHRRVRLAAEATGAEAVLMCSDAFFAEFNITDDQQPLIDYIQNIGVSEAIKLGLVERREAIICHIELRSGGFRMLRLYYRREGGTDVGRIILGERVSEDYSHSEGRMVEFFK